MLAHVEFVSDQISPLATKRRSFEARGWRIHKTQTRVSKMKNDFSYAREYIYIYFYVPGAGLRMSLFVLISNS